MTLRRYRPEDYPRLKDWSTRWAFDCSPADLLPAFGIVVDDCVMGFLSKLEPAIGVINCVVSDPDAPRRRVGATKDVLLATLFGYAKEQGLKQVVFWTTHPMVSNLAHELGMSQVEGAQFFKIGVK